ncbi:DUF3885 domain-containing protein [Alkalihalobacillus sp. 1P02AB]|uniref:DUF3885 domain-containing protein n=1 Tax=Alkalihalobacillus sp. 1P02AB TaxID=3132260 RepID=UPI0039A4DCB6
MNELQKYLRTTFPQLQLRPSLLNQAKHGLHIELGDQIYQFTDDGELNMSRFEAVYQQTAAIFNELFSETDELFLVSNLYLLNDQRQQPAHPHIYDRFLKNNKLKNKLIQMEMPYILEDDEPFYYISQLMLKCSRVDFNWAQLMKATAHEDFPLHPQFNRKGQAYYPDIFLINKSQNLIFFIYDDRGCEVVAANQEQIQVLKEKFEVWVETI